MNADISCGSISNAAMDAIRKWVMKVKQDLQDIIYWDLPATCTLQASWYCGGKDFAYAKRQSARNGSLAIDQLSY